MKITTPEISKYTSTRNACKLCSPLGASVVFKGIRGCVPLIHGSQGCSTYIRRYMISHYKEPVDIASSNFSEETTIFGGNTNFNTGIDNIISQYHPEVIGIASTCLSETIGEDVPKLIYEYKALHKSEKLPEFVYASTPSYQGSHLDGFYEAVTSTIKAFACKDEPTEAINLFPGFVSPEDIRHLKDILTDFGLQYILFPDYSDSLDNPHSSEYKLIPDGGTPVDQLRLTGQSKASIEFGEVFNRGALHGSIKNISKKATAAEYLEQQFLVKRFKLGLPIGINATDNLFDVLSDLSCQDIPLKHAKERGRLVDSYVDGHKYLFGKRAIVYGEEDLVIAMVSFLEEIGINVVLAASGGESGMMKNIISKNSTSKFPETIIRNGMDFEEINEMTDTLKPDIMIGNSKGYYIARKLGIPLVRIGFPIHDRIGAQRIMHLGYKGTQQLFDRITNALIEYKQDHSPVGYKYM